jgi:hypothetical protein
MKSELTPVCLLSLSRLRNWKFYSLSTCQAERLLCSPVQRSEPSERGRAQRRMSLCPQLLPFAGFTSDLFQRRGWTPLPFIAAEVPPAPRLTCRFLTRRPNLTAVAPLSPEPDQKGGLPARRALTSSIRSNKGSLNRTALPLKAR